MPARLSAKEQALRAISEKDFLSTVTKLALLLGWLVYHAPDNLPGPGGWVQNIRAGFPDLVLVRGKRLLFLELKRETGKTTQAQDEWLFALRDAGVEAWVVRPSMMRELRALLA
jgi:hypothetical protein